MVLSLLRGFAVNEMFKYNFISHRFREEVILSKTLGENKSYFSFTQ